MLTTPSLYLLAAFFIPNNSYSPYHDNPKLLSAVENKLVEETLLFNTARKNKMDEMIPASTEEEVRSELRRYREFCRENHGVISRTLNDLTPWDEVIQLTATWWRLHRAQFPQLARLSQGLLAVQATSVTCERAFSDLGFLFSERRRSMTTVTLEAISLIRGNIPDSISLNNLVEEVRRAALQDFKGSLVDMPDPFDAGSEDEVAK